VHPGNTQSLDTVSLLDSVIGQNIPLRFGFVLGTSTYQELATAVRTNPESLDTVPDTMETKVAKVFYHIREEYGIKYGVQFLRLVTVVIVCSNFRSRRMLYNFLRREFSLHWIPP
jgi:hypothetical protein